LDHDLAQVGAGSLKLGDIVAGEGAALLTTLNAAPGEVRTEVFDLDLKTRGGKPIPMRLFHKVAFGADGAPGASRTLALNRARGEGEKGGVLSGLGKYASCVSSRTRQWQLPPSIRLVGLDAAMRGSPRPSRDSSKTMSGLFCRSWSSATGPCSKRQFEKPQRV